MEEALDAIIELLDTQARYTARRTGSPLDDARLQLQSCRPGGIPLTIAAALSPSGPKLAGRHGLGLLWVGGTSAAAADLLARSRGITWAEAATHGSTVSRDEWAIFGTVHLARSDEQALEDARFGLADFMATRTSLHRCK